MKKLRKEKKSDKRVKRERFDLISRFINPTCQIIRLEAIQFSKIYLKTVPLIETD